MMENEQDVKEKEGVTSAPSDQTDDGASVEASPEDSQPADGKIEVKEEAPHVDYEAELRKLRESRDREKTIAREERRKRKEAEGRKAEEPDEDEESSIVSSVEARFEAIRREAAEDMIEEELDMLTEDPHERALIREIYDSRIAGKRYNRRAIRESLEDAKFLANKPRFKAQLFADAKRKAREEIRRETTASNVSGGPSTRREPEKTAPAMNADERRLLDFSKKAAMRGYPPTR